MPIVVFAPWSVNDPRRGATPRPWLSRNKPDPSAGMTADGAANGQSRPGGAGGAWATEPNKFLSRPVAGGGSIPSEDAGIAGALLLRERLSDRSASEERPPYEPAGEQPRDEAPTAPENTWALW